MKRRSAFPRPPRCLDLPTVRLFPLIAELESVGSSERRIGWRTLLTPRTRNRFGRFRPAYRNFDRSVTLMLSLSMCTVNDPLDRKSEVPDESLRREPRDCISNRCVGEVTSIAGVAGSLMLTLSMHSYSSLFAWWTIALTEGAYPGPAHYSSSNSRCLLYAQHGRRLTISDTCSQVNPHKWFFQGNWRGWSWVPNGYVGKVASRANRVSGLLFTFSMSSRRPGLPIGYFRLLIGRWVQNWVR